ncbi:MAG: hypothetical protein KAG26_05825 [Methylococcales bacterium]|nr:hypothetical protein [Methylococcales bacterium]
MSEIVYILTIVFVAYTVFSVLKEGKNPLQNSNSNSNNEVSQAITAEDSVSDADVDDVQLGDAGSIRNPETGETANIPNNYRFSKRWIKEVLVKEGLLDKIYKNNELTDEINAKIKQALADLQMIEKYKI